MGNCIDNASSLRQPNANHSPPPQKRPIQNGPQVSLESNRNSATNNARPIVPFRPQLQSKENIVPAVKNLGYRQRRGYKDRQATKEVGIYNDIQHQMEKDKIVEKSNEQAPAVLLQRKSSSSQLCNICFEPYHIMGRWPMLACPHDHFFCDICIEGMFKLNQNQPIPCPICRVLIRKTKVRPHYQLFRAINKQKHLNQALNFQQNQLFQYAFEHQIFQVAAAFKQKNFNSISRLTSIDCSDRHITMIQHMSAFSSLRYLRLDRNNIEDLSGLLVLNKLTYLNLSYNNISNIDLLASLDNLTHLAVQFNQIKEFDSLVPFENIQHFFMFGNPLNDSIADQLCLAELNKLMTLSISCSNDEQITQIFLKGLSRGESLPKLNKVFLKDIKSQSQKRSLEKSLYRKVELKWLTLKEAKTIHSDWLDEFMDQSQQYGQTFKYRIDPQSPHLKEYNVVNETSITKKGSIFVFLNSQSSFKKQGKVNFKVQLNQNCQNMVIGVCNQYLKHNANIYSQYFVGLTFWGMIYSRGNALNLTGKLRLQDKPVIQMSVDRKQGYIRWFSDDNQVGAVPFPQQFKHSALYFLIGMRDQGTSFTVLDQ